MLPTSWIICFDSGLKGLNDWFCRRSCWRTCRSGWFSIFWINSRTLVSPTLNVSLSWAERVWELSDTLITSCVITGRSVLSCACSTLKSFLSSDERAWITLVSLTGLPGMGPVTGRTVRSEEPGSSQKELTSISWERDVFLSSCTPITSCVMSGRPDLSRIGFRVGWFDWKLLDSCPASARWAWSEPNSLFHSCFKEIFGGRRGDMYTFSYKTSPVFILTTFGIQ